MSQNIKEKYGQLVKQLEEISRLGGIRGILHWDQEVILPEGGHGARSKQMSALAGVIHEKSTDPDLGRLIDSLHASDQDLFDANQRCNLREAKRDFDMETKVPRELVQEISELESRGHHVWIKAREQNQFSDFAPVIEKFVELKKQWANHIDPHKAPYDVNIDVFERGASMEQINPVFKVLKAELVPLIQAIQESEYQPEDSFLNGDFPVDKQEALGRVISKDIGFQFDQGRMDVSVHPFCGGGHPSDVRITTRYRRDNFAESLYAVIHETGHGLYEQGRPREEGDLPSGESMTMGIHESQSLFWERMIAQSKSFCRHYLDLFAATFPEKLKNVGLDEFYEAINVIRPSLIRVEADEATYPLHVILRYEIEQGLFDGSIRVRDLPKIWNDKMEDYLGVRPPNDAQGVLQDVHWSGGAFGYFPSYSLGAMYACQFYNALAKSAPDLDRWIETGNFQEIKSWLNKNIHSQGRLFSTEELVQRVTGSLLDPKQFMEYLKKKYGAIYRLKGLN